MSVFIYFTLVERQQDHNITLSATSASAEAKPPKEWFSTIVLQQLHLELIVAVGRAFTWWGLDVNVVSYGRLRYHGRHI